MSVVTFWRATDTIQQAALVHPSISHFRQPHLIAESLVVPDAALR